MIELKEDDIFDFGYSTGDQQLAVHVAIGSFTSFRAASTNKSNIAAWGGNVSLNDFPDPFSV
jgi:hypothetical protein